MWKSHKAPVKKNVMRIIFTASKVSVLAVILVRISRIQTEYLSVSARIRENTDQNNSEYGHFLRSVCYKVISV